MNMISLATILIPYIVIHLKIERISKTIDIESLKKIAKNDVIVILRRCQDFEGRKNFLSVAITEIKISPERLRRFLLTPSFLVRAIPNLKKAEVVRKREDGSFDVSFEVEANIISLIRPKVRYTARIFPRDDFIFSVVISGKNKGGWRQWEFIKTEEGTLAILGICEYIRVIPLADKVFSENPHFELGFVSSTPLVVITSVKNYIEMMEKKRRRRKRATSSSR